MHFLRTLFWVVIAVVAVVFSIRNWTPVVVHLWGGLDADIKLPVLLLIFFLIGFLPWFTIHKATRWQLKRKLETVQRALEQERERNASTVVAADQPPPPLPQP
ncbi:MAG: lipopolysaccharide assembly protein LapA domain-containing protein [Sphingomonadaceae bacterium]